MIKGDPVRFIKAARSDEWIKGQTGIVERILALRPQATSDIYLITLANGGIVWCTHEDIERSWGDQLTLF